MSIEHLIKAGLKENDAKIVVGEKRIEDVASLEEALKMCLGYREEDSVIDKMIELIKNLKDLETAQSTVCGSLFDSTGCSLYERIRIRAHELPQTLEIAVWIHNNPINDKDRESNMSTIIGLIKRIDDVKYVYGNTGRIIGKHITPVQEKVLDKGVGPIGSSLENALWFEVRMDDSSTKKASVENIIKTISDERMKTLDGSIFVYKLASNRLQNKALGRIIELSDTLEKALYSYENMYGSGAETVFEKMLSLIINFKDAELAYHQIFLKYKPGNKKCLKILDKACEFLSSFNEAEWVFRKCKDKSKSGDIYFDCTATEKSRDFLAKL